MLFKQNKSNRYNYTSEFFFIKQKENDQIYFKAYSCYHIQKVQFLFIQFNNKRCIIMTQICKSKSKIYEGWRYQVKCATDGQSNRDIQQLRKKVNSSQVCLLLLCISYLVKILKATATRISKQIFASFEPVLAYFASFFEPWRRQPVARMPTFFQVW